MMWVNTPLRLQASIDVWTQDTHYDLPKYDLILRNANKLFKKFQKSGSKSIFWAIIATYRTEMFKLIVIIIIYTALEFSTAFILSKFIENIISTGGKIEKDDFYYIPGLFSMIVAALFLSSALRSYVTFELNRLSYLSKHSLNFLIF